MLVSQRFWYFGAAAVALPEPLQVLEPHTRDYDTDLVVSTRDSLAAFLSGYAAGIQAPPTHEWPVGDVSWQGPAHHLARRGR